MPKLAAFPKAWLDDLCRSGAMSLGEWIGLAAGLGVDGLEFYGGMYDLRDARGWASWRHVLDEHSLAMPMLCCSPDFTHPDAAFRRNQVALEKHWIDMTASLGGRYCRVLSGQRRPGLSMEEGLTLAANCILECLPYAADRNVTLTLENHYKDNYWMFPEFAREADVFCALVERIDRVAWPNFGVNFDPSNALLAGEDPLALLARIRDRVVTMHASDRYLTSGTLADLRVEEQNTEGYAARLAHGTIGEGLNDYDAIFSQLEEAGFDGWISIEDGMDGLGQLKKSVEFLRTKIAAHWPAAAEARRGGTG